MSRIDGDYWDEGMNPIKDTRGGYHCTKCSMGCHRCWAERLNVQRMGGQPYDNYPVEYVFSEGACQKVNVKKHRFIFVCHLCDLFHERVPDIMIERTFAIMERADHNTYLVLTKRPHRLERFLNPNRYRTFTGYESPGTHIMIGATVCNQEEANDKIPRLLSVPGRKWLSLEPIFSQIDLSGVITRKDLDWITIGEESDGYKAGTPAGNNGWWSAVRPVVDLCRENNKRCWVKQVIYQGRLIRRIDELPVDVRVREWPRREQVSSGAGEQLKAEDNGGCTDA